MKDLSWIKSRNFAHRGLHDEKHPENTMAAFKNAVEHNYDIELDIHFTLDKQIVVVHDHNLKRLCNADINVEKSTYQALKKLTVQNTLEHIPLLTEVLAYLPVSTHLLIEFKTSKNNKLFVLTFLNLIKNYQHTYAIHSFDPRIVNQFKKQDNKIIRGIISQNYKRKTPMFYGLTTLKLNFWYKPDFVNYEFNDLPNKHLDKLYKKGMCIISYTVHNKKELDYVRKIYDNAVFENFII